MFSSSNINSFVALTNVFMSGFYFISVATSRRLSTNIDHNFLPFFTMRLNVISINCISNKVSSFMAGSVVNKSISILMKKFVVECDFIVSWNRVTSATTLQLEADDGEGERNSIDILGFGIDFFDSLHRFVLHFSHAYRLAPCTISAREK